MKKEIVSLNKFCLVQEADGKLYPKVYGDMIAVTFANVCEENIQSLEELTENCHPSEKGYYLDHVKQMRSERENVLFVLDESGKVKLFDSELQAKFYAACQPLWGVKDSIKKVLKRVKLASKVLVHGI